MSRSSSNAITLRLSPHGLSVDEDAIKRGHMKPWPAACRSNDMKAISAALEHVSLKVKSSKSKLDVVLDNAWTRFQLVSFPAGVRSAEERQAFLKASFHSVFGAESEAWRVVAEPAYFGAPVLAVAVDAALPTTLAQLAERCKLSLRSLQPRFVEAFNDSRDFFAGQQGAFAQIEGDRVCMALWRARQWVAIRSQPITVRGGPAVSGMLSQMLAHIDPPMSYGTLYVDGGPDSGGPQNWPLQLPESWTSVWLPVQTS